MKKSIFSLAIVTLLFIGCKKEQDPFQISKQHIGLLTDSTQVKDLKAVFANDSVVERLLDNEFTFNRTDIDIFDKTGNKLLTLTPKVVQDSTSTIETIKVLDARFKTEKGISTTSTFADIEKNYKISSIQNTLKNIVVFVNEINAFFTISKSELPSELQFDTNAKIEAVQIPGKAKIKYFMIGW
ncbi:hypothetical protein [Xanthomarina spongicola]|jgi:uncharacterized lipoprotein NlpE involved in copper resistance|uniref:Uncharacterized protein n=1 Tax=Xanthomarina spongicola TaxID=570520 RepID=A0A316DIS8_9FLAO|nr:hypothetical protein [Xanthomarina spongicola]PWK17508.1 hypothetical protein LX78_02610 [Xanthomarina spongicola]